MLRWSQGPWQARCKFAGLIPGRTGARSGNERADRTGDGAIKAARRAEPIRPSDR
jgi:hypothetical protein